MAFPTEPGEHGPRTNPPTTPPPGWYVDPAGTNRWWDGTTWGPAAPGPPASTIVTASDDTALAVLSWLSFFFGAILVPLIVYLVVKDDRRPARWHAAEALNFQLTFMAAWLLAFGALFGVIVVGAAVSPDGEPPLWIPFLFVAIFGLYGLGAVVSVIGAVQAGRRRDWRCPVAVPILRAHRRDAVVGPA